MKSAAAGMRPGVRRCIVSWLIITINILISDCVLGQISAVIQVNSVPVYGAWPGSLSGKVVGVSPSDYRVAALVFVPGLGFYSKPYCSGNTATTTALSADGSFSVLLTTGGVDQDATFFALLLVPASTVVTCYAAQFGVPDALKQQAVAEIFVPRPNPQAREIVFAGEKWLVKTSPAPISTGLPEPISPGPNYFADSQDNVWVDGLGRLHLRITHINGNWYCAEIVSERVIGYGRYSIEVESNPTFDKNVVFGAFSWAEAEQNTREIDMLELSRFGDALDPNNAQNGVLPLTLAIRTRFLLSEAPTVHKMTWLPRMLDFESRNNAGASLHQWTYGPQLPPVPDSRQLNFRLNLWLVAPPSDGNEAEIIVSNFSFTPLPSHVGIFRPGVSVWATDNTGNVTWDVGDSFGSFGLPSDIHVQGDWDGSGTTKIGVFRPSTGMWALDMNGNQQWDMGVDRFGYFGSPGDTPVVGDWDGSGKTKVGIYRSSAALWALDINGSLYWDSSVDRYGYFGSPGDTPIVGDWDGSGKTKVGIYRSASALWALDTNGSLYWDSGVDRYGYFGLPGDTPILGDWDGSGKIKVGIYRSSAALWALDNDGSLAWTAGVDQYGYFGLPGDTPIVGKWQ